ncbi:hypothetical protein ACMYYO_13590 [Dermacoccaceae bacterium W4C1]
MRQIGLTLTAHPSLPWAWVCTALLLAVWIWRRGFHWRRLVSGIGLLSLVTAVVAEVGPQPIGYATGVTQRVCDVGPALPLAPWSWGVADVRVGPILMFLVVGTTAILGSGRARVPLLFGGLLAPPLCEAAQWVFPQIARTCTTLDIADAYAGLAVGVGIGFLLASLVGHRRRVFALTGSVLAIALAVTLVSETVHSGDPELETSPQWGQQGAAARRAVDAWIASGTVPGAGTRWEAMARAALSDIDRSAVQNLADQLPPAGEADRWRMFWPRDGAFLAVALARSGHAQSARELLVRMAALPFDDDHGLDARFLLNGKPVDLDPRAPQADNCGWVLWSIKQVGAATPLPASVAGLRSRCLGQLVRLTGAGSHVPGASADYWEVTTWGSSLGVSAPVLLGLRSAADDSTGADARLASASATRFARVVQQAFGPGYQRFGDSGGLDASVCMLVMPDADPLDAARVQNRCHAYQSEAVRTAGGLAPGVDWKDDGISWTPQTALVAYIAASSGDRARAARWLDWLNDHRSSWGSLPEKVLADGSPAGPAPLLWTSSLVLMALASLAADDQAGSASSANSAH